MGVRVDYLSPVLYLVDIFWSLWVLLKIINLKYKVVGLKNDILSFQNILIFIFVVVNFLVAGNKWVAIYRWLRIGQWVATYKLLKNLKMGGHIGPPVQKILGRVLPWWIGLESLLGLAQVVKGGSLQGVFYWLGERNFDFGTIGIAQMSIVGNGLTRAYGTFSHPNSLAGFLLVALVW